jgi:hypothetical protein
MRHVLRLLAALLLLVGCMPTITLVLPAEAPRQEPSAVLPTPGPPTSEHPEPIERRLKELLYEPHWL